MWVYSFKKFGLFLAIFVKYIFFFCPPSRILIAYTRPPRILSQITDALLIFKTYFLLSVFWLVYIVIYSNLLLFSHAMSNLLLIIFCIFFTSDMTVLISKNFTAFHFHMLLVSTSYDHFSLELWEHIKYSYVNVSMSLLINSIISFMSETVLFGYFPPSYRL